MNELSDKAKNSNRLRTHFNLHDSLDEPIHRLCIAAEPDTYMRPHRHRDKWELLILLKGLATVVLFDHDGTVLEKIELSNNSTPVLEISKGVWHAFFAQKSNTVMLEVKAGPYIPLAPEDFASWAPAEGDENVNEMLDFYRNSTTKQKKVL